MGNSSSSELVELKRDETPLTSVMGMTHVTFNKTKLIFIGERHAAKVKGERSIGDLLYALSKTCTQNVEVFVEDNFSLRAEVGRGERTPEEDGFTMTDVYRSAYNKSECSRIKYHLADVRNAGIMHSISWLQEQIEADVVPDPKHITLLLDTVEGHVALAYKIVSAQLRSIVKDSSSFVRESVLLMFEDIKTSLREARERAHFEYYDEALMNAGFIMDMTMNAYLLARMARKDHKGNVRIAYTGEMHRRHITASLYNAARHDGREGEVIFTDIDEETPVSASDIVHLVSSTDD